MFNEEDVFPLLRERLSKLKSTWGCAVEILLVDDCSRDRTPALSMDWAQADRDIKVIRLSRNFGHQIATTAGLHFARGDAVVMLDADLQDPPELIGQMLRDYCDGYDVVYGQRIDREGETAFKLLTARFFYLLMRRLVVRNLPENTGDFRLMSRRVVDHLKRLREHDRFLRGLVTWMGYEQKALPYHRDARGAGQTKYTLLKMIHLATNAILSFSDLPLRMIIWLGMLTVGVSAALIVFVLYKYVTDPARFVPGYASLAIMISFFSGMILTALGMLGLYVGRIYTEVLSRPLFLVAETANLGAEPASVAAEPPPDAESVLRP